MSSRNGKSKRCQLIELPIAPMIDVVFLLLIYFMVSSTIQKQETDLSFSLPGLFAQDGPLAMPDEQIIRVQANGQAILNEFAYDAPASDRYSQLAATLSRFQQASVANRVEASVTIAPDDATPHQAIVKVMDACALAGIEKVGFALE